MSGFIVCQLTYAQVLSTNNATCFHDDNRQQQQESGIH